MFLPGMTERSSTPLATVCGLSVGALEDWRLKKFKFSAAATYIFIRCSVFCFLPFIAAQFVRGDFSAHLAVELRAEEGHAKAQFKRDPLIFR